MVSQRAWIDLGTRVDQNCLMNQDINLSNERREAMLHRLVAAIRSYQTASEMFDHAYGSLLGVNDTDARCLDIIQRFETLTPGQLAEQSGLTTGAVTTVLDRLEKSGYARRTRVDDDRRKVHIELTEHCNDLGALIYGPLGAAFSEVIRNYTEDELFLITRFCELGDSVNRELALLLQRHLPMGETDAEDRKQRAKAFARESDRTAQRAVEGWKSGDLPEHAYQSGKQITDP